MIVTKSNYQGTFYTAESKKSEYIFECANALLGNKFSACYRFASCWMKIKTVKSVGDIPAETQYLLSKTDEGYVLYFLLCDKQARASLFSENGKTYCRIETGDKDVPIGKVRYMYSLSCKSPYEGIRLAYKELADAFENRFTPKERKKIPNFINHLGYCTYNAFSSEVTHDNLISVEETFTANEVPLGFIIADEGWMSSKDGKLAAFTADKIKFPNGLKATIETCKTKYGLKKFICWHTYNGYWKGVDPNSFPEYNTEERPFHFPERFRPVVADENNHATVGNDFYPMNIADDNSGIVLDPLPFFEDFYKALQEQGADGTKIDAMTWAEAFSDGYGGRVQRMNEYLRAIENASFQYMNGEYINCSSCSNDFFQSLQRGSVTRTSCDFMPDVPDSHGEHILTNAFVGFWTQPIVVADWDMFESGSEWGFFHAASKAVSGGPIYCTDKPEKANFSLLKKLSTKDGRVLRCRENAKPTTACLFGIPEGEPFRIFNQTDKGYVLAAFGNKNCKNTVKIPLSEIDGLPEGNYAVYSSSRGFLGERTNKDEIECTLLEKQAEIFTVVPIENGIAVIGLTEKLNPSAYVKEVSEKDGQIVIIAEEEGIVGVYRTEKGFSEYHGKTIRL